MSGRFEKWPSGIIERGCEPLHIHKTLQFRDADIMDAYNSVDFGSM